MLQKVFVDAIPPKRNVGFNRSIEYCCWIIYLWNQNHMICPLDGIQTKVIFRCLEIYIQTVKSMLRKLLFFQGGVLCNSFQAFKPIINSLEVVLYNWIDAGAMMIVCPLISFSMTPNSGIFFRSCPLRTQLKNNQCNPFVMC